MMSSAAIVDLDALGSGDIITVVSVVAAGIGVLLAVRYVKRQVDAAQGQLSAAREQLEAGQAQLWAGQAQLKRQALTARGQFLLGLQERFRDHDPVHLSLRDRPGDYQWWAGDEPTRTEWAAIEAYMGLFERVWMLVQQGLLEVETVDRLYGYRIRNIVKNDSIRAAQLDNPIRARDWVDFVELWRALDEAHRARLGDDLWESHPAPAPPYPLDAPFRLRRERNGRGDRDGRGERIPV